MKKLNPKDLKLSKKLSYILRHGAIDKGLILYDSGYIKIDELTKLKGCKGISLDILEHIVETDNKNRFELNTDKTMIRATQGHSINILKGKEIELGMLKITTFEECPVMVHGTYIKNLDSIKKHGLLKKSRNHIHFASHISPGEVVSGLRTSCEVGIYINVEKCLEDGILIYKSRNGVLLTEGIEGILHPKYFENIDII